jgi:hypothetical protein
MGQAFLSGAFAMQEMVEDFGVDYSTLGRDVRRSRATGSSFSRP